MKHTRPLSVSIIAWYLIVTSVITILSLPSSLSNPVAQKMMEGTSISPTMVILMSIIGILVNIVSGIGMLKAKEWGRKTYFIGTPLLILFGLISYTFKFALFQIMAIVVYSLVVYFLTRKVVLAYFQGKYINETSEISISEYSKNPKPITGKLIASVILLFFGGIFLLSWLMTASMLLESVLAFIFTSVIFLGISSALVIFSLWLLGWHRWPIVLGSFFLSTGSISVLTGCMFFMFSSPDMKSLFKDVDISQFSDMGLSAVILGVLVATIGGLLIYYHRISTKQEIIYQQP